MFWANDVSFVDERGHVLEQADVLERPPDARLDHVVGAGGPEDPDPLILPRNSEGLFLLQRIRDEAHRFAITFHRSRRSKIMLESLLDDIPGLGEVRARALMERFGSVAALRKSTHAELSSVPGIGEKMASIIEGYLEGALSPVIDTATGEVIER